MKKLTKVLLLCLTLSGASLSAAAQIYVEIRPVTPVIIVTAQPNPTYIWIGEEWIADGPNYRYVGGYWGNPPSPGYKWKKGYWSHSKGRGNQWIPGKWHGNKKGKKNN